MRSGLEKISVLFGMPRRQLPRRGRIRTSSRWVVNTFRDLDFLDGIAVAIVVWYVSSRLPW